MSNSKDVFAEATEGGSIGVDDMRLSKVVTVIGSDDRRLVAGALHWCVTLWVWK